MNDRSEQRKSAGNVSLDDERNAMKKKTSGHRPSSIVHRPTEGDDFYREGAFIVFTARYHLRRGYCCESGCRHCPFRGTTNAADDVNEASRAPRGKGEDV
jgi:hypothetical protein